MTKAKLAALVEEAIEARCSEYYREGFEESTVAFYPNSNTLDLWNGDLKERNIPFSKLVSKLVSDIADFGAGQTEEEKRDDLDAQRQCYEGWAKDFERGARVLRAASKRAAPGPRLDGTAAGSDQTKSGAGVRRNASWNTGNSRPGV